MASKACWSVAKTYSTRPDGDGSLLPVRRLPGLLGFDPAKQTILAKPIVGLQVAPGIATRNKQLLGAPGLTIY